MKEIRTAIIGVGNCAKSLIEGIHYYSNHKTDVGLIHSHIGDYSLESIKFVAAFDINEQKVGLKISDAIYSFPNNTQQIYKANEITAIVSRGPTLDGLIPEMTSLMKESSTSPVNVCETLVESKAEVVVSFLPTGSDEAAYFYASEALKGNCHFINCMPTSLAKNETWQKRFSEKKLLLFGDDIKSQCGATIVNRTILNLFRLRGVTLVESKQVNYGGNTDHFNLKYRNDTKKKAKEESLKSINIKSFSNPTAEMVYREELYDHKIAHIKVEGRIFGNIPVLINAKLEDEDSPNCAGMVIDLIRFAKYLKEKRLFDEAKTLSSFYFKSPPFQMSDEYSFNCINQIIGKYK
jgi:myo-inositol-1-phosphate synthase